MSTTTTLFVPCDLLMVHVQFTYGRHLSAVEQVVIRAIHAGRTSIPQLIDLLGLGDRVTLDLLASLCRRGYATFDFRAGTVAISDPIRAKINDNDLGSVSSADVKTTDRPVIVDKLTGSALPGRYGLSSPRDRKSVVPVEGSDFVCERPAGADLRRAVQQELADPRGGGIGGGPGADRPGRAGRPVHVLSAHVGPADGSSALGRRWLPLQVRVGRDTMSERLLITVVEPRLSAAARELAAGRLTQLVRDRSRDDFARTLDAVADVSYVEPPPFREAVKVLRNRAEEAAGTGAGLREQRHTELASEARRVAQLLDYRIASEVDVTAVNGARKHVEQVERVIGSAARQVVLVCPGIRLRALNPFLPSLQRAINRGVQVVVVWGRKHDDELEDRAMNALGGLRDAGDKVAGSLLVESRRAGRVNVGLAIADDRRALLTGYPFLDRPAEDTDFRQLGLLLDAPGGLSQTIESLLLWAQRALPRFEDRQSMYVRHSDFAREREHDADRTDDGRARLPELICPQPPPDQDQADTTSPAVKSWSEGWVAVADELARRETGRTLPAATLVEDGAHYDLLWQALRSAVARIVVSATVLAPQVVNPRFVEALRERLAKGVAITVAYSRVAKGEQSAVDLLDRLAEEYPGRFTLVRTQTFAKVLVVDDMAVVGSFDYLSTIPGMPGQEAYRRRAELSVRVTGGNVADLVAAELGTPCRPSLAQPAEGPPAVRPPALATAIQTLLNDVDAAEEADRPRLVRDALTADDHAWEVVAGMTEHGVADDVLRVANSAAHLSAPQEPRAVEGLRWLIDDRWRSGAFVEAHALRMRFADPNHRPRPAITRVAAGHVLGDLSDALIEAALLDKLDEAERVALVVTAVAGLLVRVDDDADTDGGNQLAAACHDVLKALADRLDGPWQAISDIAVRHWQQAGKPLPVARIQAAIDDKRHRQQVSDGWHRLRANLDEARKTKVHWAKTHAHLFHPQGPFGQLDEAAAHENAGGFARGWPTTPIRRRSCTGLSPRRRR